MSDSFFGGTSYKKLGLLDSRQSGLLGTMVQNYDALGARANSMQSAYQGAPEQYFQRSILNPLQNQYQDQLAGLSHTGKRHSSFNQMQRNKLNQNFLTQVGQLNSEFQNQERQREMQAINDLRSQQAQLYGIQGQFGQTALNRQTFENVAQQDSGMLGKISSLVNLGSSIGSGFAGLAMGGKSGSGLLGGGQSYTGTSQARDTDLSSLYAGRY